MLKLHKFLHRIHILRVCNQCLELFHERFWNIYVSRSRNFPATNTKPVVTVVSQATRAFASFDKIASKIESEIWSQILSGCPSVTDSDVNR